MALFTSLHNISHADGIFHGNSNYSPGISKWLRDGQPITAPFRYDWDAVAPKAGKATGIMTARTFGTAGTLTMVGTLVTTDARGANSQIATMDVPRAIAVVLSSVNTAFTLKYYGLDYYGEAVSEELPIPANTAIATVNGKKAVKIVLCIAVKSTNTTVTGSFGFSNILGLPFTIAGAWDCLAAYIDTTADTISASTITAADVTSPATAVTGDVRGTYTPGTAPNASRKFRIWFTAIGKDTRNNLYGVPQFSS